MFSLERHCQLVLQSAFLLLHPHEQCMRLPVAPHPRQHLLLVFWILAIPVGVGWYLIAWICNSLRQRLEHLFTRLCKCVPSSVGCLSRPFAQFLNGLFFFTYSWLLREVFTGLIYWSFISYGFCKYILLVCGLAFPSLNDVFCREVFNLNEVQLTNVFLHGLCFWYCI